MELNDLISLLAGKSLVSKEDYEKEKERFKQSMLSSFDSMEPSQKESLINDFRNGILEGVVDHITEKSKQLFESMVKSGDEFISLPFFLYSVIDKITTGKGSDLDNSFILRDFLNSKSPDELSDLKSRLLEFANKAEEDYKTSADSKKAWNIHTFTTYITATLLEFSASNLKALMGNLPTEDTDESSEYAAKFLRDSVINYKYTTEDLFMIFVSTLQIRYKTGTSGEKYITYFEELYRLFEEFGFYKEGEDELFPQWLTALAVNIFKEAKKNAKNLADSKKGNGDKTSYKTITQDEFVRAGNDGSRKVLPKKDLDVDTSSSDEVSDTPYLDRFGEDLCKQAIKGKIDPLIGRETEIRSMVEILSNRKKKSVVLIGKPGTGKTAIVEYLAQLIVNNKIPSLKDVRLISIPMSSIQAGASMRGELEGRMENIIKEVKNSKRRIILYMDEMHQLGSGVDGNTIGDILKPSVARGEVTMIGSTTDVEFRRYIEKDRALERRFSKIIVEEPTLTETVNILKKSLGNYSNAHKVLYPDDVIEFTVLTASRYLHDNSNPDLSFGILDRAGSACALDHESVYKRLDKKRKTVETNLAKLVKQKTDLVFESDGDPDKLADISEIETKIEKLQNDLDVLSNPDSVDKTQWPKVTIKDVAAVISRAANVPIDVILEPEIDKLAKLKEEISKVVIGQSEAVDTMARALCRSYLGLRNPNRPIASFMFIGPTGVGKTELAKKTAEIVFGTSEAFLRIDGGEYSQPHTDTKLLGAPPSFVGHGTTPPVFDKIRKRPYTLVLVDEVEKIHPDIINKVFLSILDEGVVTLSDKTQVDMRNCVIVFTGNVGSDRANKKSINFFESEKDRAITKKAAYTDALQSFFRPEFLGRLTDVICFNQLDKENMGKILELELEKFQKNSGKTLRMTDELKEYLLSKVDYSMGARNLAKVIQQEVENKIADAILNDSKLFKKKKVDADIKDGNVIINFK